MNVDEKYGSSRAENRAATDRTGAEKFRRKKEKAE
jgi:hypothetical protein